MRVLSALASVSLALLMVGCGGKARHVVIEPDYVAGRKDDAWRITAQPTAAAPATDDPAAAAP